MYWPVALFEIICWTAFVGLASAFGYQSYKQKRVVPGLWLFLGIFSVFWIEAPFDNAMYAQFHPDFSRLPMVPPFYMTQGGLPTMAPPGYILYFLVPSLIAVGIAKWVMARYNTPRATTLLTSGLAFGIIWDVAIEEGQAQTIHLWTFSRVVPGGSLGSGMGLYPLYIGLGMAAFIVFATYIMGNTTAGGDTVVGVWAKSKTTSPAKALALQAFAYIVLSHFVYFTKYLPHAITKYAGMLTQSGALVPYPGKIAMQPPSGEPQSNGLLGAIIMWSLLIGGVALTWWWAKSADRLLVAPTYLTTSTSTSTAVAADRKSSLAT